MRQERCQEADLRLFRAQQLRRIELVFIELRRLPEIILRRVRALGNG